MLFTSSVRLHCFLSCLLESLTPFVPPHPRLHFLRTPGNKSKVMVGSSGNLEDNNGRFSSSSYSSYSSFFCLVFLSCVSKLFCFLEGNAELKLWLPPTQGHPAVAAPRVLLLHFPSSLLVTPQHTSTDNLPLGYFYPHKPLFASLNSSTQWPHSYTHSYPSGLKQSDYFRMGFSRNVLRQGLRVPRRTWKANADKKQKHVCYDQVITVGIEPQSHQGPLGECQSDFTGFPSERRGHSGVDHWLPSVISWPRGVKHWCFHSAPDTEQGKLLHLAKGWRQHAPGTWL